MTVRSCLLCFTPLLLALFALGCGSGPKVYPVEGTVYFQDDPAKDLAGGTVSFESVEDKSNASGEIQADGTFRLQNQRGGDGVPAGKYRVLILPPPPEDSDRPPPPIIDKRYHSYDAAKIEVTVEEKTNKIPIKIERLGRGKK